MASNNEMINKQDTIIVVMVSCLLPFYSQNLNHGVAVTFFCAEMVKMTLLMPGKIAPICGKMAIFPKFVFFPHGQAYIGWSPVCVLS